jgi:O-antigen/teichoic acid export membrane protein
LIVKHFFSAESAGQYAALALIGRIVFFATWSVVTTLFPIVAQKQQRGEAHRHLLGMSLGLVTGVSVAIIIVTYVMPDLIVRVLFGQAYLAISELLWLYAIATMLYALSNVFINYHLSIGRGRGSFWAMVFGLLQVIGLWCFHTSLREVVIVQIIVMTALFITLVSWDLWLSWQRKPNERRTYLLNRNQNASHL